MQWEEAASAFSALGSGARLRVLRSLVRAGAVGLNVGELQERTEIAPSTLAYHLKFLTIGGVIEQTREGRTTVNRAAFDRLQDLGAFLLSECCADDAGATEEEGPNDG